MYVGFGVQLNPNSRLKGIALNPKPFEKNSLNLSPEAPGAPGLGFGVWGLGLGFRVWGLGFMACCALQFDHPPKPQRNP